MGEQSLLDEAHFKIQRVPSFKKLGLVEAFGNIGDEYEDNKRKYIGISVIKEMNK